MDTNNQKQGEVTNDSISGGMPKKETDKQYKQMPRKKKKRHVSALVAAAVARSAVNQVGGSACKDTDFRDTGTNLSYREEG